MAHPTAMPRGDLFHKLWRYALTGGGAAVVDLGGFILLERAGLPLAAAAIASFLIATVVNFTLSSRYVFTGSVRAGLYPRFLLVALIGLCINAGATVGIAHLLAPPPALAKTGGIGIAFLANFLMNHFLVFKANDPDA